MSSDGLRTYKKVGSTVHEYEYSGGKLFYEKRGDIQFYYRYDALGNLATITRIKADGEIFNGYVICNSRGDVEEIRYSSGEPYARYVYDSWGNTIAVYDANGQIVSSETHLAVQNPIRYRGYYWDSETKLYYLQSRYYDPVVGRFISADSVLVSDNVLGFNTYAYCYNNPINNSDTNGNSAIGAMAGLSGIFSAVGSALSVLATVAAATIAVCAVACVAYVTVKAVGKIAEKVCEKVEKRKRTNNDDTRDQSVYVMRNQQDKVEYVGRTKDPERRKKQHGKDPKKSHLQPLEVVYTGLNKDEARVLEQVLISAYSIENLCNARREIAVGNVPGFYKNMGTIAKRFGNLLEDELINLIESR